MVIIGHIIATIVITISSLLFVGSRDTFEVHQKPDSQIAKAIYLTAYTAGNKIRRSELIDLINKTELNAVVIDIKDYTGRIGFLVEDEELKRVGSAINRVPDMKEFIGELHEKGIYVIGRISVFQDSYLVHKKSEYAVKTNSGEIWKDNKGVSWLDVGAKPVWEYCFNRRRSVCTWL